MNTAEDALHAAICNAVILLNNGEEIAPRVSAILRTALFEHQPSAREIAAQPGEGELSVAIASALADFDGMDEASLHALRWSYGAQPEPMGDAWCMDYLPRGEAIARLLATRNSPPHVADALDGERDTLLGALLDEWEFKTDSDLAYEMRENGIGTRLDALLSHMNDPEHRS